MSIPKQEQWLRDTSLHAWKPRSARLRAVDDALLQFEKSQSQTDLWRVKSAFDDWKRFKGPSWEQSARNWKRALTVLNTELNRVANSAAFRRQNFDFKELMALRFVAQQRKKAIQELFAGKQVTFKASKLKEDLAAAAKKVKETCSAAATHLGNLGKKSAPPAAGPSASSIVGKKLEGLVRSYFGVSGLEMLGELGGYIIEIFGEVSVSVPPVVGTVKSGYDLFTEWASAGTDLYKRYSIAERNYVIDTGVPAAAFQALIQCLTDEAKNQALSASASTASFALTTGLTFVDGGVISGPVVGALTALADFARTLYLLAVEWRATQAINKALSAGQFDIRLFRTYPLMGCYFLVSATMSDLIPIESFGTPGWMDMIENLNKHGFAAIYTAATQLIASSPWEILGLPKRPKGSSGSVFTEVSRFFSTVSPLAGLRDLVSISL